MDPECFVAPGFEKVLDTFKKNLQNGIEKGGSYAVYYKGELVVNLWGGVMDPVKKTPWKKDTLSMFYSSTKAVSAIVIAHLVDRNTSGKLSQVPPAEVLIIACDRRPELPVMVKRGLLDYKEKISTYWPEFAQKGKESITLEQYLLHSAGLVNLDGEWNVSEVLEDYPRLERRMAEQEPYWTPGTEFGYHALTFALYLDALVRKVDPKKRTLSEYFNEEFARPLGRTERSMVLVYESLDFYIGLPEDEFKRATVLINIQTYDPDMFFEEVFKGANKAYLERSQAHKAPADLQAIDQHMNKKEGRKLPVGSSHGSGTAESLAKLYGILANGGQYKGKQVLSEKAIRALKEPAISGVDQMLGIKVQRGMGTWLIPAIENDNFEKQFNLFGHPGAGGQYSYGDTHCKLGVSYTSNFLNVQVDDFENFIDERFHPLILSTYDCIRVLDGINKRIFSTYGSFLKAKENEKCKEK